MHPIHKLKAGVASLLIALQVMVPTQAWSALPTLGDGASSVTTGEERRLGDGIVRELYRDPDYIDDPVLQEYVEDIWLQLQEAARAKGELSPELQERFAWTLLMGRDGQVNAFALPGGYMGVYLGLVGIVATRDELASVIAHETTHITQRHIARMMAEQGKQAPLLMASMLLGALAAARSGQVAQAVMVGAPALMMQNQLNFSREMEREADRMGYSLMAPGGFAPQGFVDMFGKLQQASRLNDNGSWPYLRSHPLTTERISDMHSRMELGKTQVSVKPTLEHVMVSARARVLSRPGPDALRQWAQQPRSGSFNSLPAAQQVAQLYQATLSSMALNDWLVARDSAKRLLAVTMQDAAAYRQARLLSAQLELKAGQAVNALAALPAANASQPTKPAAVAASGNLAGPSLETITVTDSQGPRRPELLLKSDILLSLKNASSMAAPLQTWVTDHPRDGTAWQTLAQVWRQDGQELRALRADAEAQMAYYDYAGAVDRFKAAQDFARKSRAQTDHFEASIVDTRLRVAQELLGEQTRDKRINN